MSDHTSMSVSTEKSTQFHTVFTGTKIMRFDYLFPKISCLQSIFYWWCKWELKEDDKWILTSFRPCEMCQCRGKMSTICPHRCGWSPSQFSCTYVHLLILRSEIEWEMRDGMEPFILTVTASHSLASFCTIISCRTVPSVIVWDTWNDGAGIRIVHKRLWRL